MNTAGANMCVSLSTLCGQSSSITAWPLQWKDHPNKQRMREAALRTDVMCPETLCRHSLNYVFQVFDAALSGPTAIQHSR